MTIIVNLPTLTAEAYLAVTEPGTLAALLDAATALQAWRNEAASVARSTGFPVDTEGRYPVVVWRVVFAGQH